MNGPRSAGRPPAPVTLLLISALVLVVTACSTPAAATPTPTEALNASPKVAATAGPTPTEELTPTLAPGIGTQVQVGDEQYVTVTVVEQWPGTETQQPAAGKLFVTVNIRIDAITTTSFTSEDFTVQDVDGNSYSQQPPGRAPHLSFQNGLEPNHFYAGFVTFEVPTAAADTLLLVYIPNFLGTRYEIKLY